MAGLNQKRIEKWDILKFLLISLVVFGHVLEFYMGGSEKLRSIFVFIYTFHMPVFIFISGMFSRKNINEGQYNKFFSYLVLYFFIKILHSVSRALIYKSYGLSLFHEGGAPWYALALFAFCFITAALKNFSPKYIFIASVILACFAGYDTSLTNFLAIPRLIVFYPFFYAGYCLEPSKVEKALSGKYIRIASVFILAVFAAVIFINKSQINDLLPLLSGKHSFSFLEDDFPFGGLYRLGYYIVAFLIGSAVIAIIPNKFGNGFVAKLGSRSLQIYSLHYVVLEIIIDVLHADVWFAKIFPDWHPKLIIFPITFIAIFVCSLKFWQPIMNVILKPKVIIKK